MATYGEQTLVPDKLGMAIFYKLDSANLADGEFDHLIVFKPLADPIEYYFLGAWEKEKGGITNEKDFYNYLNHSLDELEANNSL